MNKRRAKYTIILLFSILIYSLSLTNCKKTENPIKFPIGSFPDSVFNIEDINSQYDDYNISLYQLLGNAPIIFSSNRKSSGGQFDLEQAIITFTFDQTTGTFGFGAEMTTDQFLAKLIQSAQTAGNDFGPYRIFSTIDGYEYMILSSVNDNGNLDLFYLKNYPTNGVSIPRIDGPSPVNLLNSENNEAYLCFNVNMDTAYYTSDKDGDFDIYYHTKPAEKEISSWFDLGYSESVKVDNINSSGDDKCPLVFRNIMIFASDRPGGLGGFDLYYSILNNGTWSSPVNLGPDFNTQYDEYRPVLGYHPDFDNEFIMFSSNRTGGKGGFDLYFSGIKLPE